MTQTTIRPRRLIELPPEGIYVFVGDTHGDLEATCNVFDRYLKPGYRIVFLGDYVDRGFQSEENVKLILGQVKTHPDQVFALQGNHEGYMIDDFKPANFWDSLLEYQKYDYASTFADLPLAVSVGDILATHGGIPNLESLAQIDDIKLGDNNWRAITWGDLKVNLRENRREGSRVNICPAYFKRTMKQLGKELLIRSHESLAPIDMYGGKAVTVFTTFSYPSAEFRTVAIADFNKHERINSSVYLTFENI